MAKAKNNKPKKERRKNSPKKNKPPPRKTVKKLKQKFKKEKKKRKKLEKERKILKKGLDLIFNFTKGERNMADNAATPNARIPSLEERLEFLTDQVGTILTLKEGDNAREVEHRKQLEAQEAARLKRLEEEAHQDDMADANRDRRMNEFEQKLDLLNEKIDNLGKLSPGEEAQMNRIWAKMQENARRLKVLADAETNRPKPFSPKT